MSDTDSPTAAWPSACRISAEKCSNFLTKEDATWKSPTQKEKRVRGLMNWAYWILRPLDILNHCLHLVWWSLWQTAFIPWEFSDYETPGRCPSKKSKMTYRSVHKRRYESWILSPHKFCPEEWRAEWWGSTGDYLQFLCGKGGGSSLPSYSSVCQVPRAVLSDPLGQAQSVISAQVAHCWGAQVANQSVWDTAGGKQETDSATDSGSARPFLFLQKCSFPVHISADSF